MLVIGYGNELRGDDGAGVRVVEGLGEWERAGVEGMTVVQLTPDMAEGVARRRAVVFVDAAVGQAEVVVREVGPAAGRSAWGHRCEPEDLLAWARGLYGRHPRAWLVTVPGERFELGAGLSPRATEGVEEARARVRALCEECGGG